MSRSAFLISSSYRSPINYNAAVIEQGIAALDRLYTCRDNLTFALNGAPEKAGKDENAAMEAFRARRQQFIDAMEDDLNTADAIAALFELVRDINVAVADAPSRGLCEQALSLLNELCGVLGLLYDRKQEMLDADVEAMIAARAEARKQKNWAESDRIRDELKEIRELYWRIRRRA